MTKQTLTEIDCLASIASAAYGYWLCENDPDAHATFRWLVTVIAAWTQANS